MTWKGEKRDLHALQGVFARPVRIVRRDVTNGGAAVLAAESVWKWGDAEPIVRELATVTVLQEKEQLAPSILSSASGLWLKASRWLRRPGPLRQPTSDYPRARTRRL